MALAIAGRDPVPLTTGSAPLPFPADVPVDATLMDGTIVDLNIMTRRSSLKHDVQRLSGSHSVEAATGTSLVLALDPLQVANNSDIVHLNRLDSMIIEDGSPFTIEAVKAAFFLISLQPI